jgi:hypothetical protein
VGGAFVGYEGIQGSFEQLWRSEAGSADEPEILQRYAQGCVGPSRGLEDPKLPLSAPTVVCSSLLHLRSPWKDNSAIFALYAFCIDPVLCGRVSYVVLEIRSSEYRHSLQS